MISKVLSRNNSEDLNNHYTTRFMGAKSPTFSGSVKHFLVIPQKVSASEIDCFALIGKTVLLFYLALELFPL